MRKIGQALDAVILAANWRRELYHQLVPWLEAIRGSEFGASLGVILSPANGVIESLLRAICEGLGTRTIGNWICGGTFREVIEGLVFEEYVTKS
jgi:hypothetical protein